MNRKIYLIGMMALAMLFASCKKEEKPEEQEAAFSITASTENDGSKTYLEGSKVKWYVDDKIEVFDQSKAETFTCKTVATSGTEANFTSAKAIDDLGEYWAFYPYNAVSSRSGNTFTFNMSAEQNYKDAVSFADDIFPMAAHYSSGAKSGVNLQFKNACGILKIHATGNTAVTKIVLTDNNSSNNALSGNFTFNPVDKITAAAGSNGNVMTLTISPAVTLTSTPKDFYMILPPGCLAGAFNLKFYNGTELVKEINKTSAVTGFAVERSKLKTANVDATKVPSFSVGGGVNVQFAPGNLVSSDDGGNWRFQPNQWTHTGIDAEGGRGWFFYSNELSGTNYGIDYVADHESFVDWGNLFPGQGWRTLTTDEWHYVVFDRTNASNLRELTYVNGVYGLMLLPDGWNFSATYNSWSAKEAAGAVFLPRTSSCVHWEKPIWPYIHGMTNFIGQSWTSNDYLYYWAAPNPGETVYDNAYYLQILNGVIEMEHSGHWYARAVRLVKNV